MFLRVLARAPPKTSYAVSDFHRQSPFLHGRQTNQAHLNQTSSVISHDMFDNSNNSRFVSIELHLKCQWIYMIFFRSLVLLLESFSYQRRATIINLCESFGLHVLLCVYWPFIIIFELSSSEKKRNFFSYAKTQTRWCDASPNKKKLCYKSNVVFNQMDAFKMEEKGKRWTASIWSLAGCWLVQWFMVHTLYKVCWTIGKSLFRVEFINFELNRGGFFDHFMVTKNGMFHVNTRQSATTKLATNKKDLCVNWRLNNEKLCCTHKANEKRQNSRLRGISYFPGHCYGFCSLHFSVDCFFSSFLRIRIKKLTCSSQKKIITI